MENSRKNINFFGGNMTALTWALKYKFTALGVYGIFH